MVSRRGGDSLNIEKLLKKGGGLRRERRTFLKKVFPLSRRPHMGKTPITLRVSGINPHFGVLRMSS
jgi:hypothetical protein